MIVIRFYGKLRDIFGQTIKLEKKIIDIEELLKYLEKKDPAVEKLRTHLLFSINKKQAAIKDKINDGDEIALFITPTGG